MKEVSIPSHPIPGRPRVYSTKAIVELAATKVCRICGVEKALDAYNVAGTYASGLPRHNIYCKPCYSAYVKSRLDPGKEAARAAKYNKANPHIAAASMRRFRAKNPERAKSYLAAWRKANPDSVKVSEQKKRLKRKGIIALDQNQFSRADWTRILEASDHKCFYCGLGFSPMTMDHVVPLARGGRHVAENIVPACRTCNSRKQATDAAEFAEKSGRFLTMILDRPQSETAILKDILVAVTAIPGSLLYRNNTGNVPLPNGGRISFGCLGSPDIMGCYKGNSIGIEVKTPTGRQSSQQRNFQRKWESSGGIYIIVRSVDETLSALAQLSERRPL